MIDPNPKGDVWVFAEQEDERLSDVCLELCGKARELADRLGVKMAAVLGGWNVRELSYRLGWFTKVRWLMGAAALLVLLVSWYGLGVRFYSEGEESPTMVPAVNVVLLLFLYNAAFAFLVHIARARSQVTRRLINQLAMAQLVCDMVATCTLVHFTGGVENFFIVLVLLPLVIATELLPKPLAYASAVGF